MTRFTTLVVAIVTVTLVAVGGIVAVAAMSDDRSATTVTTIIGFCATITASMLAILRAELNAQEMRSAREAVDRKLDETKTSVKEIERKVNGNLEAAIDKAVQAERSQLIAQTAMPKTTEELEALLHRAVELALRAVVRGSPPPSGGGDPDTATIPAARPANDPN